MFAYRQRQNDFVLQNESLEASCMRKPAEILKCLRADGAVADWGGGGGGGGGGRICVLGG